MIDPRDAVVAIRSFPRRWREVIDQPDLDPAVVGRVEGLRRQAAKALAAAASTLGWDTTGELDQVSDSLARHVEESGPDRWRDDAQRRALDEAVQEAAAALRQAEQLASAEG